MILVGVEQSQPKPYWQVKAVIVVRQDGTRHVVWKKGALARLGVRHPEVLAQLTHPS